MQTRRDQVQAHTFVVGRLVSAMLRAEPDAQVTPLRRFTVGVFIGTLAGIVLIAAFGIIGYIKPGGNKAFRQPGALIVEKETGARYVLIDGQLKPVLNTTSAKLLLGDQLQVVSASKNSLEGVPHGLPVGIPTAPDALPEAKNLDATGWQVCSTVKPDVSGEAKPFVTLRVGDAAGGSALADNEALVVVTEDGTRYLAWKDRRLRIPDEGILGALGYGAVRQYPVGPAWLNALPAGPDLAAPALPEGGEPGPTIGGRATRVGQLFEVDGTASREQFFLVDRDGLVPLTATGAALVLGDPRTKKAYPGQQVAPLPLDPAAVTVAPRSGKALLDPGLPPTPPQALSDIGDDVPCLQINVGGETGAKVRVALSGAAPRTDQSAPAPLGLRGSVGDDSGQPSGPGLPVDPQVPAGPFKTIGSDPTPGPASGGQADQITVKPGGGLLMRALPGPGVQEGTLYLLVDTGVRYPLPEDGVAGALGYGGVPPVPVPTTLLGLIPAGPPLDPEAAKNTQAVESQVRP